MSSSKSSIQTPEGPVGEYRGTLEFLGVSRWSTSFSAPDALGSSPVPPTKLVETLEIDVPVGTRIAVPVVSGWSLNYETQGETGGFGELRDNNWGAGQVKVVLHGLARANYSARPPHQKATLQIYLYLTDTGFDDAWSGTIEFHVLCYGTPRRRWWAAIFRP